MNVLIVDDEAAAREYLVDAVESSGHTVATAENGSLAMACVQAFNPDIVLTDIQMPVLDGLELVEDLRKSDLDLIIVVLTAFGNDQYARRAVTLGADAYVQKPLRVRELLALLANCERSVEKRRALPASA